MRRWRLFHRFCFKSYVDCKPFKKGSDASSDYDPRVNMRSINSRSKSILKTSSGRKTVAQYLWRKRWMPFLPSKAQPYPPIPEAKANMVIDR
jgi:hypothetical protein